MPCTDTTCRVIPSTPSAQYSHLMKGHAVIAPDTLSLAGRPPARVVTFPPSNRANGPHAVRRPSCHRAGSGVEDGAAHPAPGAPLALANRERSVRRLDPVRRLVTRSGQRRTEPPGQPGGFMGTRVGLQGDPSRTTLLRRNAWLAERLPVTLSTTELITSPRLAESSANSGEGTQ